MCSRLSKGGRIGGRSTWPVTPTKVQYTISWFIMPFSHHSDRKYTTGQPLSGTVHPSDRGGQQDFAFKKQKHKQNPNPNQTKPISSRAFEGEIHRGEIELGGRNNEKWLGGIVDGSRKTSGTCSNKGRPQNQRGALLNF